MVQMDYIARAAGEFPIVVRGRPWISGLGLAFQCGYPPAVRRSLILLRRPLAALLVGLLMLASAAPCTAAAASPGHPVISAPADPCHAHHGAPASACAQLACQQAADLSDPFSAPVVFPSAADFPQALAIAYGRTDAPPLPPPRNLL